jgi:hypothetical protein
MLVRKVTKVRSVLAGWAGVAVDFAVSLLFADWVSRFAAGSACLSLFAVPFAVGFAGFVESCAGLAAPFAGFVIPFAGFAAFPGFGHSSSSSGVEIENPLSALAFASAACCAGLGL